MITKLYSAKLMDNIGFGRHYINVDMGASSENVSCKLQVQNERGKVISEKSTTVFKNDETRSTKKFENNVAKIIADFDKTNEEKIRGMTRKNKSYEPVVTVCCPGPPVMGKDEDGKEYEGNTLPNIKGNFGGSFTRPISGENIIRNLRENGLNVHKYIQVNDTDATGVLVLETLKKEHPEVLEEGKEVLHLYPGGGLGNGVIEVSNNRYICKTLEMGSVFEQGIGSPPIEKKDRSSVGLLDNFCKKSGFDSKLFNGDAKVATDYEHFKKLTEGAGISCGEDEYRDASWFAIEKLMNCLAGIAAIQICRGKTDTIAVMGPTASGARKTVNNLIENDYLKDKYPEAKCFEDVMKSKIYGITNDIRSKFTDFDLKIVFLDVKDNTKYAHKLHNAIKVGTPVSWYEFPKKKTAGKLSVIG